MFKYLIYLILFISLNHQSFGQRTVWTGYSVYNSILNSFSLKSSKSVVILDELEIENHSSAFAEAIKSGNKQAIYFYTKTSEVDSTTLNLIVEYCQSQSTKTLIAEYFDLPIDVILTNKNVLDKMFKPSVEKGWQAFKRRYPKTSGLFRFSSVHFSKDVKTAVFYFSRQQVGRNGYGDLVVMESVDNIWKVKYRFNLWRS